MNNDIPTFVKWAGGKLQLLEQYQNLFPMKFERYFEPFLGSGAVFFYIEKNRKPREAILSDSNEELTNAFIAVRDNVNGLIQSLKKRKNLHSKEYFYKVRKEKPAELSDIERASRLIYLNKTCYNGLYRVNSRGQFNVPFGDYKNPAIFNERTLGEASKLLHNADIQTMSFEKVLDLANEGDFIYFDPPYFPISKTSSFTSYTSDVFLQGQQRKLSEVFRELDERKSLVMLSNSDHPLIRGLYKGFLIHTVKARRAISCVGMKRGAINEIVVTNYKPKGLNGYISNT